MQAELAAAGTGSVTLPPAAPAPPTLVPVAVPQATQVEQAAAAALLAAQTAAVPGPFSISNFPPRQLRPRPRLRPPRRPWPCRARWARPQPGPSPSFTRCLSDDMFYHYRTEYH